MSMPSRASTSLLQDPDEDGFDEDEFVSMPSRASTSLLRLIISRSSLEMNGVNALTG